MGGRQFIVMFYKNFIGQLRQIKRNIMLLTIPLLIFLFIYLFFSFNRVEETFFNPLSIGVIASENNIYTKMLANSFKDNEAFNDFVTVTYDTKENIYAAFYNGTFDAIVEVPDDFADAVMYFEYSPVIVKVKYDDPLKALLINNVMLGYEKYITSAEIGVNTLYNEMKRLEFDNESLILYNEMIAYELIFTALSRNDLFTFHEIVDIPSVGSLVYFFIAIVVMFLMYIAVFSAINLIRERENMCFTRLKISRTSIFNYILSKALGTTCFIALIVFIWAFFFMMFSNVSLGINISSMVMFLIIAVLFDVSLAMMISGFIEREEGVILFSNVFIFINAIIGGSIIPIHIMPDSIQNLAQLSPNFWMIRGFLYFGSGHNTSEGIFIGAILLVLSLLMILVTSYRYNRSR